MPLPRENRIFLTDNFNYDYYNEIIDYGGTGLPTHYDVTGDVFTLSEKFLKVSGAGKLVYNGEFEHNNFAIYVLVRPTSGGEITIQTRYSPSLLLEANFLFADNEVCMIQVGGFGTLTPPYPFIFSNNQFYLLGLWAYESNFYAWVNDYQIVTMFADKPIESTFALNFVSGDIEVHAIKVYELTAPIDPTLEDDPSNLLVEYRKFLQTKLATVTSDDWEAYREAHNRNRWNRNIGQRNINWEGIGYPVPKPSTDAFFN